MDFKALQLFSHLAISLHFGKTSAAMHVSPSTLSRIIQRLEGECGCPLFARNNRTVELTHAGEKLLSFCTPVLSDWRALQQSLNQFSRELTGVISIYCSVTASQSHLPAILSLFRKKYSLVDFKLETGDPGTSFQKVLDGEADLAIAMKTPDMPAELRFSILDSIPLVLALAKGESVSSFEQVDWHKTPIIMPERGPSRNVVHQWFAEAGIRPQVYASVSGNEAIVSMVALGCGVGFVPDVVVRYSSMADQVNIIEVPNIEPFQLGLCCLSSRQKEPLIAAMFQQLET